MVQVHHIPLCGKGYRTGADLKETKPGERPSIPCISKFGVISLPCFPFNTSVGKLLNPHRRTTHRTTSKREVWSNTSYVWCSWVAKGDEPKRKIDAINEPVRLSTNLTFDELMRKIDALNKPSRLVIDEPILLRYTHSEESFVRPWYVPSSKESRLLFPRSLFIYFFRCRGHVVSTSETTS